MEESSQCNKVKRHGNEVTFFYTPVERKDVQKEIRI